MLYKNSISSLFVGAVLLAACSDDTQNSDSAARDDASYTLEELQSLAEQGRQEEALTIIANRRRQDLAATEELQLALTLNLQQLDGIAAEVLVERLVERGVTTQELVIPKARAFFLQGQLDKAKSLLETEDLSANDAPDANLLRADIAGLEGDLETQAALYQQVIDARPEDFRGYLGLALQAFEQADFDAAERYGADALAREERDPIANYVVGATALYQGDDSKAQVYLEKSVALRPGNVAALTELANLFIRQDNIEAAEKTLDTIYTLAPNNRMARFLTAQISAGQGDLAEAERQLILSEEFARTYLPATRTYGLVTYGLGKYAIASRHLERFLQAVPSDRNVRLALVDSLIRQGKGADALKRLEPVLNETSDDLDANLYAASAKAAEGAPIEAIAFYEKALSLMQAEPTASQEEIRHLSTKIAISRFLAGQPAEASAQLQALQAADMEDFDTLLLLANIHLRRYDNDKLLAVLDQMETVRPGSLEGHNFRGVIAYRAGDPEAAVAAYSAALQSNPDYFSALKNRGLAYLAAQKPDLAMKDLLAADAMNPDDGQIHAFLGRSHLELGDFDGASSYLKKAEAALPTDPVIQVDYAEALAGRGLLLQAIEKATRAKPLAGMRTGLADYIDKIVADWQAAYEDQEAAKAAMDERLRAEARERLARERDGATSDSDTPDPSTEDKPDR